MIGAIIALSGVVSYLFKEIRKESANNSKLTERVGRVEGRHDGIEKLSQQVLDMVTQAKKCRYEPSEDGGPTPDA